jgi:hypothetical protein
MRAHRQDRQPDDVLGPRALAAMAEAARRSREAADEPETSTPRTVLKRPRPTAKPDGPVPTTPEAATRSADPPFRRHDPSESVLSEGPSGAPGVAAIPIADPSTRSGPKRATRAQPNPDPDVPGSGREHRPRSSRLIASLSLLAIVAALVGTWAIKGNGGTAPSSSRSHPDVSTVSPSLAPPTAQAGASSGGATTTGGTTLPAPPTTAGPSSPTSLPVATSGGPLLTTLIPASGNAGQVLVIEGSSLVSPSGQITAHFGTETATVACPAQTSCIVQVPPNEAPTGSVPFTVTTDTGTSNALTFSYSQ